MNTFNCANILPNLVWKQPKVSVQTYFLYLGKRCLGKVYLQQNTFKGELSLPAPADQRAVCSKHTTIVDGKRIIAECQGLVEQAVVEWFNSLSETIE